MQIKVDVRINDLLLRRRISELERGTVLRRAASSLEQILVDHSPVDTGLLRANWQIGTGSIPNQPVRRFTHSPTPPPKPINNTLTVYNNINYVQYANIRARRVPPRFIERSLRLFFNELKRILRTI